MQWKAHLKAGVNRLKQLPWRQQLYKHYCRLGSCDLCGLSCQHDPFVCDQCIEDLPKYQVHQSQEDLLNQPDIFNALSPVQFDQLIALSKYTWPFDHWIGQLKYQQRIEVADLLGRLLASELKKCHTLTATETPLVIPVPLHAKRFKSRLFNQSELIANIVAKQCALPICRRTIIRRKATKHQVGLSGSERRKNLKGAFELNAKQSAQLPTHVILIDDVMTTGATLNAIATLLKKSGVEQVTAVVVALSLPEKNNTS